MGKCRKTIQIGSINLLQQGAAVAPIIAGSTVDFTFDIINTSNTSLTNVVLDASFLGLSSVSLPDLAPQEAIVGPTFNYTVTAADELVGQIVSPSIVTALDRNGLIVSDTSTVTLTVESAPPALNLFFTTDGTTPISWTGTDYVEQCFRVDADTELIRGIAEATTYINNNYLGQTLNVADGTWDGPANGPIMVHDATLLMTSETTVANETITLPLQLGIDNVMIDWGDGSPLETINSSLPTHQYVTPGQYQTSICGNLDSLEWSGTSIAARQNLISIDQWGDTLIDRVALTSGHSITSIDPNLPDSVTSLFQFLQGSTANPDLTNLDVSNVTDFRQVFFSAPNITPNTATWDTSNATDMTSMFSGALAANPDVTNWDVSGVTSFSGMFNNADSATPNTATWNTSSVTDMSNMFFNANIANSDVSNWDVSSVTNMSNMFTNAPLANPDVTNWDTSAVTNMTNMFNNADSATPDVSAWDTSSVITLTNMFQNALLANPDVTNWDVSSVTNFTNMFSNADSAIPNVTNWDVSSATNINGIFAFTALANPDVSLWDVSNVTNFANAFNTASSANPDVSAWDVSSGLDFNSMFNNADLANPDVSLWNVSLATNMSGMFSNTAIANPDVSGWNVSSVTNFSNMFNNADSATPDVSLWNVSSGTNMASMFANALIINPDVSGWNVSNVTNMFNMFGASPVANPDVSGWDIQSINITGLSINNIFNNSGISVANYDAALIQFDAVATLNSLTGFTLGTIPSNFTIATSGAARANLVGPLAWSITDNGGI